MPISLLSSVSFCVVETRSTILIAFYKAVNNIMREVVGGDEEHHDKQILLLRSYRELRFEESYPTNLSHKHVTHSRTLSSCFFWMQSQPYILIPRFT